MDVLRARLQDQFALNAKIEGLGELEQIDVQDRQRRYVAVIEHADIPLSRPGLRDMLVRRGANLENLRAFHIRVSNWTEFNHLIQLVGNEDGAWVFAPDVSRLFSGAEYASYTLQDRDWDYRAQSEGPI
ncbi:MAG TPA: hypothetical protein VN541_14760 [Tepidisphaeraceae bacterium]|nr:hypothetical protein [Tepidisphaeraceae bacterium]